jgi:hypothetical protein
MNTSNLILVSIHLCKVRPNALQTGYMDATLYEVNNFFQVLNGGEARILHLEQSD